MHDAGQQVGAETSTVFAKIHRFPRRTTSAPIVFRWNCATLEWKTLPREATGLPSTPSFRHKRDSVVMLLTPHVIIGGLRRSVHETRNHRCCPGRCGGGT